MKNRHILTILLAILIPLSGGLFAQDGKNKKKETKNYETGLEYYKSEKYDDARFYLLKEIHENPDNVHAIQMLVNIEERTEHYSTAIVHVNELLAFSPYDPALWEKKISLYRLIGNDVEADRLLERLCLIYPEDKELQRKQYGRLEELYLSQRKSGDANGEIEYLRRMLNAASPDNSTRREIEEMYISLSNKLLQQGRELEAMDAVSMGLSRFPSSMPLIRRKVGMLEDQGRYAEAYVFVRNQMKRNGMQSLAPTLRDLEDEILVQAQMNDPYIMHGKMWESRGAEESLQFLISTSISRGYLDDAQVYLLEARKIHGDTPELLYKSYIVERRLGNEGRAMQYLKMLYKAEPGNQEAADILAAATLRESAEYIADMRYDEAVVLLDSVLAYKPDEEIVRTANHRIQTCNAFISEKKMKKQLEDWEKELEQLHKDHKSRELIALADSALAIDPTLEMAIYYKGLAHERLHEWDKAYECLKKYNPSAVELDSHKRHLVSLQSHDIRNTLTFDYQQARLGIEDRLTANAGVEYSRTFRNDHVLTAGVRYTSRDTEISYIETPQGDVENVTSEYGGVGIQLSASYRVKFTDRFSGEFGGSWANKYFPMLKAGIQLDWELPKDWTIGARAAFRRVDSFYYVDEQLLDKTRSNIYSAGVLFSKGLSKVSFAGGADAFLIHNGVFFNVNTKITYYPLEFSKTSMYVTGGAGTAPETELIDNSLPSGFSNLNTFVGAGAFLSLSRNLGLALNGTWYNLRGKDDSNKNYFYINAALQISF